MGSCCFTPSKRHFLWWYWLLLASIVGIPMLAAVLYVAWSPEEDEEHKKRRGKQAAWIFWVGTVLVAIATFIFVNCVFSTDSSIERYSEVWIENDGYQSGWLFLAVQFFFATFFANATNDLVRKNRWYYRIPLLVFCIGAYLFVLLLSNFSFNRPAINVMQFLACMLPAHFWGKFKDSPDTRRAWFVLIASLIAASLFFLVSFFGEDFAQWICGPPGPFSK